MQHHSGLLENRDRQRHLPLRDHQETLLRLAQHLNRRDRLLLENRFARGMTISELAMCMRMHPNTVRSRIHALIRDLGSPEFGFLVTYQERLPDDLREVAEAIIFDRKTLRETAKQTSRTLHEVRKLLERFRALSVL